MSWRALIQQELKAIFTNPSILFTVFGGVLIYSFLYPLPYANQLPREQQVVVVNLDQSQLSRELERMVDATPQVALTLRATGMAEAQAMLNRGQVQGLLVIPEFFARDLLLGQSPTLAFAGDAAYFLVYGTVVEGLAKAGGTLGAKAKVVRMVTSGENIALASQRHSPIHLTMQPVFNPGMGYIDYIVPAVFVLILHQTLLIAVSLLGSGQRTLPAVAGQPGYWHQTPAWQLVLVRALVFVLIYLPLVMYYFGFSFTYYHISRLATIADLLAITVPFLLAVIGLGMILGHLLPRRELAIVVVLLSSIPLIFSLGFIWPASMIPAPIQTLVQLIPATPAVNAFLRLNQMGAEFHQVLPLWTQLWGQAFAYGVMAWLLQRR
ncbi:ABC transporter permease [Photobacterium sp. TY1-4]|uniref:ABC transporter permease n=1 Tax=Photobacterium sp. TY1-4 TaxID=2899122 RepID=UPI0021C1E9AF|nr:ABC transporter permease [Photobacterium sp. TY1-4]UXI04443.1 ABC transporter permease [Photobacterium sp. TY1-4]